MKKSFFLIVTIFVSAFAMAQQSAIDERLLVKFSKEELKSLIQSDTEKFEFLNYCLDNAWYISPLPKKKMNATNTQIGSIAIQDLNEINFYSLNVALIQDNYQFFAIEGTEKMLVIKSIDHIKKEMK